MRERVTVSVPGALLRKAERVGKKLGLRTRSAIVVDALERLVDQMTSTEIDASLDDYYAKRSNAERTEEAALVRAFRHSRRRLDLDGER